MTPGCGSWQGERVPALRARRLVAASACVIALCGTLWAAAPASASCAFDPNDPTLTIKQMIRRGTTGDDIYDVLFLGRVKRARDLEGQEGGEAIARIRVREHPVGFAPRFSRVRFYDPPPGVAVTDNIEFRRRARYAVVANRFKDGTFASDGACGQSARISPHQMRILIHLSRHH